MKEDEKVYTFREKKKLENLVDFQRIGPLKLLESLGFACYKVFSMKFLFGTNSMANCSGKNFFHISSKIMT